MRMIKVGISFLLIALLELIAKFQDKNEKFTFEIAMSILMAAWVIGDGW